MVPRPAGREGTRGIPRHRRARPVRGATAGQGFLRVDLPPAEFRRLGYHAIDLLASYYATLDRRPIVPRSSLRSIERAFDEPLPRRGQDPRRILDAWRDRVVPRSAHLGSPRFLGYVHGSGLQIAALADALAAGQNPNVADGRISPAESAIEARVMRWLAAMIGYPETAGGQLLSGGMAANHAALLVALRSRAPFDSAADGLQARRRSGRLTLYVTEQEGHVTIRRAADLLNLGRSAVREVPYRADFTMDVEALARTVDADRRAGDVPFCVVAQAGSINVGAIDPLGAIARVCRSRGLWFHVDGASGAFGALLPELRSRYAGLARADSVTLDPHKWLYLPKECGGLLVRDEALLRRTFGMEADYLERQDRPAAVGKNYRSLGPQSSRGFRALKVWMALKHLGTDGYARLFRQNLACVARLDRWVRDDPDFRALHRPTLYIYSFQYLPADLRGPDGGPPRSRRTRAYVDALNRAIVDRTNASGEAFLTTTEVEGATVLRVSICNHRTTVADVRRVFRLLKRTGESLDKPARRARLGHAGPAPA